MEKVPIPLVNENPCFWANPVRTITKAPFKISDQGYGGFIIIFDLYFKVKGKVEPADTEIQELLFIY